MSQLSSADGHERTGPSTVISGSGTTGSGTGSTISGSTTSGSGVSGSAISGSGVFGSSTGIASQGVAPGSVSMTPPPPMSPAPAVDRRAQTVTRTAIALVEDELGPSLTSAQLMRAPGTDRLLPDLSVSNEALLNSLRPAAENTLSLRASRLARSQSERALYWFGTRPRWLQATLSVVGGSVVGLSLVVAYAKAFHSPAEPEVAAEPAPGARAMALAAAAPAALIAQRVVQPLAPAAAGPAPAKVAPSAAPAAAVADAPDTPEPAEEEAADEEQGEARKPSRRQRASKASASGKLPAWVQQQVKPQVQRAAAREKRAAAREKRAAALREKKARRSRAKPREQD